MAQRYGGQFSPGAAADAEPGARFRGRRAAKVNIAARAMYAAPIPLFLAGIGEVMQGDALGMLAELGGAGLLFLSAILLNEGLRAEAAFDARAIARPPAIPRKLFAIAATALGVALGAGLGSLVTGAVFGLVAGGAQWLAFGLDPMRRKGIEGASDFDANRVAEALDNAEQTVSDILAAARQIGDRHLEGRVERMLAAVRDVFRTVEEDPRDLTRARKFLGVYLTGARDATQKFAQLYTRRADPQAKAEYVALLDDLETSFRAHREDLLRDDKTALDVEIEVLRERLHREGV
ncbi:MAG: 5-bromo-4-chloroindolyl phosphate hydrolysis family protein [Pseudomonadota bacterium]